MGNKKGRIMSDGPLEGRNVAVLMGGLSPERDVSLVSGRACADALDRLGARVTRVDAGRDIAAVLTRLSPDVCFNALHGAWGEDGCIQGVLETLAIPYTHSGVLASALAMDKAKAKAVMAAAGVAVPGGGLFSRFEAGRAHVMAPPYVVKPNAQGSSVGVIRVFEGANGPPRELLAAGWTFGDQVMIEPYVAGLELAVTVMAGKALAVTEIEARTGFYDYEAKYGEGGSTHILPARLPAEVAMRAMRQAEAAHAALGCQGVTRSDFRYDDVNRVLVLLEVNTQPGMTPTSLAPEQAAHVGIGFDDLVLWIVEDGYARGNAGGEAGTRQSPDQGVP
jgi:D-alanine-D-alanine ligase